MAHAQCTKQLSRLRPSAHAYISCVVSTLQWPASTFRGNKQREILKSSNGMKTFDLQAFCTPWLTLHADAFFWREH